MQRSCYAIEQHQSQWVVSVCGARVLTCKTRRAALKAARRALVLLHQTREVEILGQDRSPSFVGDDLSRHAGAALERGRHGRRAAPAALAGTRRG
jgi:hypothetical protein